jgi:hypothetical protein
VRSLSVSVLGVAIACLMTGLASAVGNDQSAAEPVQQAFVNFAPSAGWRNDISNPSSAIDAYSGAQSVAAGGSLALYVRAAQSYRVAVYRIGWYDGAGGALVACLPACDGPSYPARSQPAKTFDRMTGEYRAPWHQANTLQVGADWPSGYYQADVVGSDGKAFPIPFIVRGNAAQPAPILVVAPVNTWEAYNEWGGKSLYSDPRSADIVSFDRPYRLDDAQLPWRLEYPLARFLAASGFQADYITDADLDADPTQLTRYGAVVLAGHSEYWTLRMRAGLEYALGHGVDVAALGGNTLYWQIRYGDGNHRSLVEYRSASVDPDSNLKTKTVRWRDRPLNNPECNVLGVEWQGGGSESGAGHRFDYVVASTRSRWFAGTGLRVGSRLSGLVDYEWDAIQGGCPHPPKGIEVLFHHEGRTTPQPRGVYTSTFLTQDADAITFTERSGARVFAAGSNYFALGIDPAGGDAAHPADKRLIHFVQNMLRDLGRRQLRDGGRQ